jgi:hypothetical protein
VSTPELSFVLVTDTMAKIEGVLEALDLQTDRDAVEVVIVLPAGEARAADPRRLEGFGSHRVVPVASIMPMPGARAAGVRAATAPVIFIGETHSYPHPEFARELIAAHRGPWDIVVPGLENANPSGARSWASFLLDYGYWLSGLPASEVPSGPTWNASYKREVLLDLDDRLDSALSSGDELPMALREKQRRFYFAPGAKMSHVNLEARGWTDERFLSGLVVGANRARRWSPARRAFYFLASPLIPFVLLYRNRSSIRSLHGRNKLPWGSSAALIAGSIVRSVGEATGYMRGITPESQDRMEEYELNKVAYVQHVAGWSELS